ncbi:MAG: acyl carrier protein [Propionibacteriaceae bacterium]|nr:acyl carrier protein [Propionibacteriaceae bacterium]
MFDEVTQVIREYKGDLGLVITPETTFSSLNLDSLETVELVMKVEEKLNVSIDMNGDINCVGDLLAVLEKVQ